MRNQDAFGTTMGKEKRIKNRWFTAPKCMLCDILSDPMIIYRGESFMIRGWKCPGCGLTFIHPKDIPKAFDLLKQTAKV